MLVWFPNSDLQTFKKRPALVVQNDGLQAGLPQVVLALITSNPDRAGHPSRVWVPRSSANGLITDSVVLTDNLATVLEKAIDRTLGKIQRMGAVNQALRNTLDL